MSSIAGNSLYIVAGKIARGGQKVEDISRDGVDYHAYRCRGVKARPSEIVTERDFDNSGLANTAILAYKAMQGSAVTVIDEDGITYSSVMVLGCDPVGTNITGTIVGGFGTAGTARTIVRMAWLLQLN